MLDHFHPGRGDYGWKQRTRTPLSPFLSVFLPAAAAPLYFLDIPLVWLQMSLQAEVCRYSLPRP